MIFKCVTSGFLFVIILFFKIQVVTAQIWLKWDTLNSPIPDSYILDIDIDANGNIWGATFEGVFKFDGTIWTIFNHSNSPIPNDVCLTIATEGSSVWIGTVWGLVEFDGISTWNTYDAFNSGLPYSYITSLTIDSFGVKWIGTIDPFNTAGGGLTKFDGTSWTNYNINNSGITSDRINAVYTDPQNTKWIGTDIGLNLFNDTSWSHYYTFNSGLSDNHVFSTRKESNAEIFWIGTANGLNRFNAIDSTWINFDTTNGLPGIHFRALEIDENNRKWVSTNQTGLGIYNDTSWIYFDSTNSDYAMNSPGSFLFDNFNNAWFGTSYGLVFYGDTSAVGIKEINSKIKSTLIVHPNPSSRFFNYNFSENVEINYAILYSVEGKRLKIFEVSGQSNTLDLEELDAGFYTINFSSKTFSRSVQIIKL